MESLHRHLQRLRCPSDGRPDAGSCVWVKNADLFGARHRIEVVWTPHTLIARRTLEEPGASEVQQAWHMQAKMESDRWRLEGGAGALMEDVSTLREALQRAASEIVRLDVSVSLVGWPVLATPRRRP